MIGALIFGVLAAACIVWIVHDIKASAHDAQHFGCRDYRHCDALNPSPGGDRSD